jgi:bifunctional polynucleotide phosphatase/kinase
MININANKIYNPLTKRYVKIDGAVGKKLIQQQKIQLFNTLPGDEESRFTLITFQDHFRQTYGTRIKVIFADLDHTLITPKGKHIFPKTIDDWKWKDETIVPKLKDMYNIMGYEIVIVSNQKKMTREDIKTKVKMIYDDLQLPFVFISGHSDLYYRKPQLGLWDVLIEYIFKDINNIDYSSSIFIGDSITDLYFARNINIKFLHTELFFAGIPNKEFTKIEEKRHPLTEWISDDNTSTEILPSLKLSKQIVIMIGSPASGKSFYSHELERTHGYLRINKDDMKSDAVMLNTFNKGLKEGRNIVIDGTNPTKESRSKWIITARKESYKITIVWMNFPMYVVEFLNNYRIAKNKNQNSHVPTVAMRVYYKKLEEPLQSEYDTLIQINKINANEMLSFWA